MVNKRVISGEFFLIKVNITIRVKEVVANIIEQCIIASAEHSVEQVVQDQMTLWGHVTSTKVANIGQKRRIRINKTEKLAKMRFTIPLGNLLPTLQLQIKNIDWAFPNMSAEQVKLISLGLAQQIEWCHTREMVGNVVGKPISMLHCKTPKYYIISTIFTPVQRNINLKGSHH